MHPQHDQSPIDRLPDVAELRERLDLIRGEQRLIKGLLRLMGARPEGRQPGRKGVGRRDANRDG